MTTLIDYAKQELALLYGGDDKYQQATNAHILKIVKAFSDEGHSDASAAYAVSVLEKLLRFKPLTPLTGADEEWVEVYAGLWQNKRCSHVFKDETGAYDIKGFIFRDPDGSCWQNSDSRRYITFPYTPKTEYIDREPQS